MKNFLIFFLITFASLNLNAQDVVLHITPSGEISQNKTEVKKPPESLEDLSKKENRFYTGKIGDNLILSWDDQRTFWVYDRKQNNFIQKQFKD